MKWRASLVEKVWSPDFSKFSNINTDAQHVRTCWKKLKIAKLKEKMYLWAWFFLFLYNVLISSQRIHKCNKKRKSPIFFSLGHHLVHSTYGDSQKLMSWQMTNVGGILQHLANITTCQRHVYYFPSLENKSTMGK